MKKYVVRLLCLIMFSIVLFTSSITQNVNANSSLTNAPMDTRTLAIINKPGVVLVQTIWTADLTFYEFSFVNGFEEDLTNAVYELIESGTIANNEQAIYSAMVQLMIENMGYYAFSTGNVSTEKVSTAAVGTGFIVTPDGYLITNAHVVATNEDELYKNFVITSLQNYAVEGTKSFQAEMRTFGYEMTQEELDGLLDAFYNLLAASIEIDNLQTSFKCFLGNVTPGSDVSAKGVGLDLRKMGTPIPGKDVAILKLDKTNLPTVTLGDDSKLRTGDNVYAMGYPAVATLSEALNVSQAIQEPTLTSGIISARKEMAGGWNIFQTDADIHGGNSGGPLFNAAGEVIGINTFGMIDPNSGAQVSGMNFAVPISIATQFLNELNVTPSESQFTSQYKKAISLFQEEKYMEALDILRGLNETNPGYPVVADLLAECRTLADKQPKPLPSKENNSTVDKNSNSSRELVLIAAIAGGVLIVIIIGVIILLISRKKKQGNKVEQISSGDPSNQIDLAPSSRKCPNCGKQIPLDSKFCNHCGYSAPSKIVLSDKCPKCNQQVQPGSIFCNNCGTKLTE